MDLVKPIAAVYRGQKGIPIDDLESEGRVGLVLAARSFNKERSQFKTWASHRIHGQIQHFIRDWQEFESLEQYTPDVVEEYFHWSTYRTHYCDWETLASSPEEIKSRWEELAHTRNSLSGALIGLSKRDRAIIEARFLKDPPQKLESIAREHKISYARVVFLVDRALKRMKKAIRGRDTDSLCSNP